ncbi:MAG: hypothetical protein C0467_15475 [Planctomycetaceae bacterium]|nr:hypothetical protein [Planctomycetaceae bacterium]
MTPKLTSNESGPTDLASPLAPLTPLFGRPNETTIVNGTGPIRRTIRVVNPLGLHMRAADRFSRAAEQYTSKVTIWNGESRANGKNLLDLIMLVVLPETDVLVEVDGPDAALAIDALCDILAAPGGEDYTI